MKKKRLKVLIVGRTEAEDQIRSEFANSINCDTVWADCFYPSLVQEMEFDAVLYNFSSSNTMSLETLRSEMPDVPIIVLGSEDIVLDKEPPEDMFLVYSFSFNCPETTLGSFTMCAADLHRIRKDLEMAESRLRSIIENNADAIIIVDKLGLVRFANRAAEKLFGRKTSGLLGREFGFPAISGEITEIDIFTPGGENPVAEMRVADITWGKQECHIASIRDITQRKRAEEAVIQSERLKAVGELATGIAHNFNNLLQVVMGGAQLASMSLEMGDIFSAKADLDRILESTRFGSETVKRLQSFAGLRLDTSTSRGKIFDLSHTVAQAIEMSKVWWKTFAEKKGIAIRMIQNLTRDCSIKGRENEVFEVAVNLIKNAVEALPLGGEIAIETFKLNNQVCFRVTDNGKGIAQENLRKIFEPFFTTKGMQSTGMGLASSYGIVVRNGGEIRAASKEGNGACFTVTFPLAVESIEDSAKEYEKPFDLNLNILIIDDIKPVVKMLKQGLIKYGQTVFCALSGREGLDIFGQSEVDLVICDLGMPEMNGWEVGRRIKQSCERSGIPKIPFILLTGWGGQVEEREKIRESGVDAVVEKPVDIPKLLGIIREVLEKPGNQMPQ